MTPIDSKAATNYLSLLTVDLAEGGGQAERSSCFQDQETPFSRERFVSGEQASLVPPEMLSENFSCISASDAFYFTSRFFIPCPFRDWAAVPTPVATPPGLWSDVAPHDSKSWCYF
jgi:hypothetical protein